MTLASRAKLYKFLKKTWILIPPFWGGIPPIIEQDEIGHRRADRIKGAKEIGVTFYDDWMIFGTKNRAKLIILGAN